MSQLFDLLHTWVEQITHALGYPGIFLLMLLENLFPPIPSEIVMPFAGFLVAEARMTIPGVLLAGTLGAGLGALALYEVGRRVGDARLRAFVRRFGRWILVSERDLDHALRAFRKRGRWIVLFGRLIPGVRSLISIPAGLDRMPLGSFLLFTLVGTTAWNLLLTGAGVLLGRNWKQVLAWVDQYETVVIVVLALVLLFWAARRIMGLRTAESE